METAPYSSQRVSGTFGLHHTIRPRECEELRRLGVAENALVSPSPLRGGYIIWTDLDRFVFEQHERACARGERAFLFLVTDGGAEPIDIIAWQPAVNRIGTWRGLAWALGQDGVYAPRLCEHNGLPVWRSPLDWLRAGRRGVVLIKPRLAADWLCDAGPLVAEDLDHALELRRLLSRPAPRILVPADTGRTAA